MIGSGALRAAAKLWYVKTLSDAQAVPVPRDATTIASGADDPDRVLIIGNGPVHGWGTVTHELALTGQLGRTLTRLTGRPTDVTYVGDEMMSLAATIPWLGDHAIAPYDLVLVVLSMNDAVRLTPVHEYRFDMERLLTKLALEMKPSARAVLAGIHPVAALPGYRGPVAAVAQRSADRLNAVTRELVGRFDGTEYFALDAPTPEPGRPYGSPAMYADWSESFAAACAPALQDARALEAERVVLPAAERAWEWEPGRRIIEEAPQTGWSGLDAIITEAREDFGVDVAYISLVDGDRQFYAANNGPIGRSVPLELTACRITVQGDRTVIVPNALKDERFRHSPFLDLTQLRFYQGTPLQNEEGENIGTFCVQSFLPRSEGGVPEERFAAYAARAQAELQRLAADRPGPVAAASADAVVAPAEAAGERPRP